MSNKLKSILIKLIMSYCVQLGKFENVVGSQIFRVGNEVTGI